MKAISDSALGRLGELLGIVSPSMQEREMTSYLKSSWGSVAPEGEAAVDAIGNLEFAVRRGDSYPTVALVAHADTICVQITQPIGTDCTSLQVVRDVIGLPTANITLPLRYMHSPVETASLSDVADAVRLVSGILEDIPEAHGFIPKP